MAIAVAGVGLFLLLSLQWPSPPPEPRSGIGAVVGERPPLPGPATPSPSSASTPAPDPAAAVDFILAIDPPPPLAAELVAMLEDEASPVPLPDLRDREMGVDALELVNGFVSIEPVGAADPPMQRDEGQAREMMEARASAFEPPLPAPRRQRRLAALPPPGIAPPGIAPPAIVPSPTGEASVAIIIDDLGPARGWSARALALPGPLTMSFLPYADALAEQTGEARRRGHEVFLHMPMQPLGDANPGRNALHVGMSTVDIRQRLAWAIGRVGPAVGMNNHMGSRMTADAAAMHVVMDVLRERGLMFVDSRTSPRSVAAGVAAEAGLPHTGRDVFLDHFPGPAFVRRQLAELEDRARRSGTAVAIGHPLPTTIDILAEWIPAAKKRGLRFIKASEAIAARGCDGKSAAGKCGLLHTAGQRQPAEGG